MALNIVEAVRGELLVAIMNTLSDFEILKTQGWYRIPVDTAPKRWPPQWIAFYQTNLPRRRSVAICSLGYRGCCAQ